jgi:hypothetical protein
MSCMSEDTRRLRAERHQAWTGEVVSAGTPDPSLWAGMTIKERVTAMTRLCRNQWVASGREIIELPRDQWPGEMFQVQRSVRRTEG